MSPKLSTPTVEVEEVGANGAQASEFQDVEVVAVSSRVGGQGPAPGEVATQPKKWSPDDSNIFSRNLMVWTTWLAVVGASRPLAAEDLPGTPSCMHMDGIERQAVAHWEAELGKRGKDAKVWRVLWALSRTEYLQGLALLCLSGFLNALVRPLVLMYAVRALDPSVATLEATFAWAAVLGTVLFVENWAKARGVFICSHVGVLRAVSACMQLLTLKAMRIRVGSSNEGSEQTLIGADFVGSAEFAVFLPFAVLGLISLVCGVVVLGLTTGATGLVGLAVMFMSLVIAGPVGARAKQRQEQQKVAAERLLACTREVLDGVKVVKMMGWEDAYAAKVKALRTVELTHLTVYRVIIMFVVQLGRAAPPLGVLSTVATYSAVNGGQLRADVIMPVLSVFQTLRLPFVMLPLISQLMILVNVSLSRMDRYLHLPESRKPTPPSEGKADEFLAFTSACIAWPEQAEAAKESKAAKPGEPKKTKRAKQTRSKDNKGSRPVVHPDPSDANEEKEEAPPKPAEGSLVTVLRDVSFQLQPRTLVGVVGSVSSGKTSLLATSWGEAQLAGGQMSVTPSVAIVPQKPFTIAGTVLDNILMGRELDPDRLETVLQQCALLVDLMQLPHREYTEVGERGVTLSGGQQQRIALARALYANPQLLLLDDPLSAVDARTGRLLLTALTDYVHDPSTSCAALLAVNQSHHLSAFDRLLVLDGSTKTVLHDGPFEDILRVADGKMADLIRPTAAGASVDDTAASADPVVAAADVVSASASVPAAAGPAVSPPPAAGKVEQLIKKEESKTGGYGLKLFIQYLRACGLLEITLYILLVFLAFGSFLFADLWLVAWMQNSAIEAAATKAGTNFSTAATLASEAVQGGGGSGISISVSQQSYSIWIGVYAGALLAHCCSVMGCSLVFVLASAKASLSLHGDAMKQLLYAPIHWHEATPSGRTISRFSADMGVIDSKLSNDLDTFIQMTFFAAVFFVYIIATSWVLIIVGIVLIIAFCVVTWMADCAVRDTRRIATNTVSPIMSTVSECKSGAAMIRCMGFTGFLGKRQAANVEAWAASNYFVRALQTWAGVAGTYVVFVMSTATAFYIFATRADRTLAASSLALTYAVIMPYFLAVCSDSFVTMRTNFAALERMTQYLDLPQEPKHILPSDPEHKAWPSAGTIEFSSVCLRYRPGLPLALEDFSAKIGAGQKCGIVGRTGAGKSTLILALFRLTEPTSGTIHIDGIDVMKLGLRTLRRAITIIPQDPVLHQGTVSHNLDPFGKTNPETLRDALRRSQLPVEMLDREVSKGGTNLSSGERQLLCFARSLLEDASILVLDEATSNLDETSDASIQQLLRNEFSKSTVLTIAHRLITVIDYQQLLVMGGGKLLEHGTPHELLQREDGVLSSMASALGPEGEAALKQKARGA